MLSKNFCSIGTTADFPLYPSCETKNAKEDFTETFSKKPKTSLKQEHCYRVVNYDNDYLPSEIILQRFQHKECACEVLYRNSNYPANDSSESFHTAIEGNSDMNAPSTLQLSESQQSFKAKKESIIDKLRSFFGNFKIKSTKIECIHDNSSEFEVSDYVFQGMDSCFSFKGNRNANENIYKVDLKMASIQMKANYSIKDCKFLDEKFNGNGQMTLILNGIRAKVLIEGKAMTPNIRLKITSGRFAMSHLTDLENEYFNHYFKKIWNAVKTTIAREIARKVADKYFPNITIFSEAI